MTTAPFILMAASTLMADLNGDSRVDGIDLSWALAAWSDTSPSRLANIQANWDADWSGRTIITDVHGATWAAVDGDRIDSPLYAGHMRYVVRGDDGRIVMGVDEE